jgi:acyl carrier protein
MENIEQRVKELLVNAFDMEPDEVTLTANLKGNLGMDSTEVVELVLALEKEFDVKLGDREVTNKHYVADVVKVIEGKLTG